MCGAAALAAALSINGCSRLQSVNGGNMNIEHNKMVAQRWSEELWGQGNLTVADEIVAPDYVRHDPGDPFPARGPD